jgi:predicted helicase
VEILDPATGTGTYICDIIDYLPKDKLEYKYKNELHSNEVAILPYYISNLNIEFTYTQKMGSYVEFENHCFVDTLDNLGFNFTGKQHDLFAPFTEENSKRIRKQNGKKIAVVIGNPPYNANQLNENDNNKNRSYPEIDKRIKDTFIYYSTAQKTKVYDMYARFYRWAMDRLDNNGIIAYITNRSFIDSRTFDGFRKCIQNDFDFAYIIDTKSDVRANPKIAGTTHNVFGIQTGVAIMLLVRKANRDKKAQCNIQYFTLTDEMRKEEKLQWFAENTLKETSFTHIQPDKSNNWINLTDNDFNSLLPLIDIKKALFQKATPGTVSNRDDWTYDFSCENLIQKFNYENELVKELLLKKDNSYPNNIKWSDTLKTKFSKGLSSDTSNNFIIKSLFRPYTLKYYYSDKYWNDRLTANHYEIFGFDFKKDNLCLSFNGVGMDKDFHVISSKYLPHLQLTPNGQCIPLYRYDSSGNKMENITDWGFNQFTKQYGKKGITKEAIFNYVYAVLHNPAYRKKYELNLKREFPRIPFYEDFQKWSNFGKQLMDIHINYETVKPYKLEEINVVIDLASGGNFESLFKAKLKADKTEGTIVIDSFTTLKGIPAEAWQYKLGNRSALEWILDQYKESKPKDPTIAEKFNTYKFSDYKEQVIDLLKRVCTVSVETVKIIDEMEKAN